MARPGLDWPHVVTLDDLEAPDPSEALRILRAVFTEPEALRPTFDRAELTEAAVRHFAELAGALHARGHEPGAVAHFLDKLLFCLFARADDPWVLSGANVHISFVGQDNGAETDRTLNRHTVSDINADLTTGRDSTTARRLRENAWDAYDEGRVAERILVAAGALALGAAIGWAVDAYRPGVSG